MTEPNKTLNEIRERHEREVISTSSVIMTLYTDIGYLLALLESHPADKPPNSDRLVIVHWKDRVSLGQYLDGAWQARGWVVINDYYCPVETWQELPSTTEIE